MRCVLVTGLPGMFLSPVFERKRECGSSFLAMGDSAGCLPISMPFLFPLLQGSWFCCGGSWAAFPEPRRRRFSSQGPPGGWERAWGPSLWEDVGWGWSHPGKVVFLLFFFTSPLFCLLGVAKSECNAQNYNKHLRRYKLWKGHIGGSRGAGGGTV